MPQDKDLKRVVRGRMAKTGESYTAARAQVTRKPSTSTLEPDSPPPPIDHAALALTADSTLVERTGHTWAGWVELLDAQRAYEMNHTQIAALVYGGGHGISGWWSQNVTVGYERIKGLREPRQRVDGSYEASKSRTFDVPIEVLFEACADGGLRSRWLTDIEASVRASTPPRSLRLQWPDGRIIAFWFEAKGDARSTLSLAHPKLAGREAVEEAKRDWTARLESLARLLSETDS